MFNSHQLHRFALRKYAVGVCSVMVASLMFLGTSASADQVGPVTQDVPSLVIQGEPLAHSQTSLLVQEGDSVPLEIPDQEGEATKDQPFQEAPQASENESEQVIIPTEVAEKQEALVADSVPSEPVKVEVLETPSPTQPAGPLETHSSDIQPDSPQPTPQQPQTPELPKPAPVKLPTGTGFRRAGHTRSVAGVIGDDYPVRLKNMAKDSFIDDWRLYNRNCTSFAAYRLSAINGFELPPAYGHAGEWGGRALREGYSVDNNPVRGSIAWGLPGSAHSSYGHVAWVAGVTGDNVTIEEYNYFGDGRYHSRTVHKSAFTGYIHFKDLTAPAVHPNQPARGQLVVQNHNTQTGDFEVLVTDVSNGGGVREVKVPIWSDKGGQDDIVWYQAEFQSGSTYKVNVKASNHRYDTGMYHIHLYYTQHNGQSVAVGGRTFEVKRGTTARPTATVDIKKRNEAGDFDIILSNLSHTEDIQEILVPTWSDKGAQDDIVWYKAEKQSNGTYKVAVDVSKHKGDTGLYHIHVYFKQYNGQSVAAATTTTLVEHQVKATETTITVQKHSNGNFDVVLSKLSHSQPIASIQVPIWSDKNGQDDLVWHQAVNQGDGTYKVAVDISKHKGDAGLYHIHLYFTQPDGHRVGAGASSTIVDISEPRLTLPPSGTYQFTSTLPIKSQASMSSHTIDYYYAGETVNYDSVLTAEGRQWISYISYGGARRYIPIT